MKSTLEQLKSRGFISNELPENFIGKSFDELIELLKSPIPSERTLSARLLSQTNDKRAIQHLCIALHGEKKLYTKIELSNALVAFGMLSVPALIDSLGKIGKNQHAIIEKEEFKKNSYPLPRDIAARTLIRIGKDALPSLEKILSSGNKNQISEAIDAIGYICYYDKQNDCLTTLISCYNITSSDLIKWKIIIALRGFEESINFLENEYQHVLNKDIKMEIGRTIESIKRKI